MKKFLQSGYFLLHIFSLLLVFNSPFYSQKKIFDENKNLPPEKIQTIGDLSVKKWKDDKSAAFSFTFDDCLSSQYVYVFPIFQQFGFKGTFYAITWPLDDPTGPYWRYGTWAEFIEMSNAGQEIGSHTVHHLHLQNLAIGDTSSDSTLIYELYQSKNRIEQKIPDQKCIDIAYPYSEYDSDVLNYTSEFYEVARAISSGPVDSLLTGLQWFKIGSKVINFSLPRDSVNDLDELQQFYNYVQSAIDQGKWGILQAHDVIPSDSIDNAIQQGAYEPISISWFESACQFVSDAEQNGDLWVAPVRDITRYMKERVSYNYNIISVSDTEIVLNLTDTLDNNIYNFPLTSDIIVPDSWTDVTVVQGETRTYTTSYYSSGNKIIETSLTPDGGEINIYKGTVTSVRNIEDNTEEFKLYQNYPNPFNPATNISFTIPKSEVTQVSIYNSIGQKVAELENGFLKKGYHSINFNASNLSSGIYFYQLISGGYVSIKKMTFLK
jgi:peptidoglycan/xylan/chitin deacetylase (PgdA/CDA1 family)